jgi:hypothetical protein
MANLIFQYPAWLLFACLLLGIGYAALLYYKDKTFREQPQWLVIVLAVLRTLAVTAIAALLLAPLLKSMLKESKKPIVLLAQDVSESVDAGFASSEEKAQYQQSFQALSQALGEDFEVQNFSFGSNVREGLDSVFRDKSTNISKFLSGAYDLFSNQNLGAIVLATDGLYNEGANPLYLDKTLAVPIYAIGLGDTTIRRDISVKRAFHNKIVYLGDKFSVQVDIAAQNAAGASTTLSVFKMDGPQNRKVLETPVSVDRNDFFTTREIILDADKPGVQRFRISTGSIPGESVKENNTKDIFVEVLDARQKILILAAVPHPDLTALKQSLSVTKNYEVSVFMISEFKQNVADYDFVILHQLPSRFNDATGIINTLQARGIPRFFITGAQTNYARLNQVQGLMNIRTDGRNTNEVQGRLAAEFSLFTNDERLARELPSFAPVIAPFGEFTVSPGAQTLLYQRIGKVDTKYPLLVLGEVGGARTAVFCAEGIWKWRLFDYLQNSNHSLFDGFLGKAVQYVGIKDDKRKFRVNLPKSIFNENEPIAFDAELYNDNYELVNTPDASITITNSASEEFNFTFNKSGRAYSLNPGVFPPDEYRFQAAVNFSGQNLQYDGRFSVQPIQLERYETTANHGMLRLLSEKYGGALVYPSEMNSIAELIRSKESVKPIIFLTDQTKPLIHLKWLFFLLLGLLTTEWFLRRYFGGY